MKITYTPNPLETVIELTDAEKEILRLKYFIENIWDCVVHITKNGLSKEEAYKQIDIAFKAARDHTDEHIVSLFESLSKTHLGDCTKVPCPCDKCWTEHFLGTHTLKDIDKLYRFLDVKDMSKYSEELSEYNKKVGTVEEVNYDYDPIKKPLYE